MAARIMQPTAAKKIPTNKVTCVQRQFFDTMKATPAKHNTSTPRMIMTIIVSCCSVGVREGVGRHQQPIR